MNLRKVKKLFAEFLGQFQVQEMKLVMEFLDLMIDEYKKDPWTPINFLKPKVKNEEFAATTLEPEKIRYSIEPARTPLPQCTSNQPEKRKSNSLVPTSLPEAHSKRLRSQPPPSYYEMASNSSSADYETFNDKRRAPGLPKKVHSSAVVRSYELESSTDESDEVEIIADGFKVDNDLKCAVCGSHANTDMFGPPTCRGCHIFFLIYLHKAEKLRCAQNQDCGIKAKGGCTRCRFSKCRQVGMNVYMTNMYMCLVCNSNERIGLHFGIQSCANCARAYARIRDSFHLRSKLKCAMGDDECTNNGLIVQNKCAKCSALTFENSVNENRKRGRLIYQQFLADNRA